MLHVTRTTSAAGQFAGAAWSGTAGPIRRSLVIALVILAVAGISAAAADIKVEIKKHKSFDFSKARTWSWHPGSAGDVKILQATPEDPQRIRAELEPTILKAVEEELTERGIAASPSPAGAALHVNYYVLIGPAFSSQHMGQFLAPTPEWGLPPFQGATTSVEVYEQGTLIIDVASTELASVVWRGAAQAKVDRDFTSAQRDERLREAVARMFDKYPK